MSPLINIFSISCLTHRGMAPAPRKYWTTAQLQVHDALPPLAERKAKNEARNLKVKAYNLLQSEVFADIRYVVVHKRVLHSWWKEMEMLLGCDEQNNDPAAVWEYWAQHAQR